MIYAFLLKRFLKSATFSDNKILILRHEFWRKMCQIYRRVFPV